MKIKNIATRLISFMMAFLLVCLLFVPSISVSAKDNFLSKYIQTIYNQKNGIGSNEVNCLYQSSSGYIWVGTDGGLYRYNGASFQSINLWDTDRTDVYSINVITQDSNGCMWIGTENYGLFYIEEGVTYHLQDEYYSGIKTIYDICESEDGKIYISASNGIYKVEKNTSSAALITLMDEDISGKAFIDIEIFQGDIWGIYDNNKICIIQEEELKFTLDTSKIITDDLSCMKVIDDKVYVGSKGKNLIVYTSRGKNTIISAGVEGINEIMKDNNGYLWVCADNGMGFFDEDGFVKINDSEIDSYLSDVIQDYEGNYWISSTRMGVLRLSLSKFVDYNMHTGMQETMVNTVHIHGTGKYIGTEDGLVIYNKNNEKVNNELTEMLNDISIRDIMTDSQGNLWISTYRKYGLVKVDRQGNISYIGRNVGLPSSVINCTLELQDGNIAVATDNGVGIVGENGEVLFSYDESDGLTYSNITCLYQNHNNLLYAGTDGGGIYTIDVGAEPEIMNYTINDGLNSDVITTMTEGESGLWIGTDNGVCLYNEAFRTISNIEYSNSIYDILIHKGTVWIVGSMGVLQTTEEELIGSQGITGRYLDANDGLSKTLNSISSTVIDSKGMLYLCCNEGICTIDTKNIPYNQVAPKIKVTAIDVDGTIYEFDDLANGLKIGSDVTRIAIDFAVFSYNNRNNIQVEYSLKGFDEAPTVLSGNDTMRAVYTNLEGGIYEFEVHAYNGDGVACESVISFTIEKETSFFEDPVAKVGIFVIIILLLILVIITIFRIRKVLTHKNEELEQLSKEHEEAVKSSSAKNDYLANMSNEIKTPINAMISKADELMHTTHNEEDREKISSICSIGNQIITKVDDIILLAKIEAGKVDVLRAPYSISTLLYDLSEFATERIGDKSIKLFVEMGENMIDNLIGDSDKIKGILGRIIDNAIKYTKEGSVTISVDCYSYFNDKDHSDDVNVVFTVSDTGIGIQEERLDSIFEVYNIADNVKNSIHTGNGIGLTIAKGYAELMGGEIDVESSYGVGSTFTLTLNQKIAKNLSSNHNISKIEETVSKEIADKLWLPDVNALLVDDEDVSREVSLKTLKQFEMKVDVASSGIGAIDMVMNNDYDVVFMDLSMPIMNGIDAMGEIRDLDGDKYSILPIIAMDTDAIEENKEKLLSYGFTDNIVKPMDIRRVAALLKDCLPESLIKEKTNDIALYIEGSRYKDGLEKLKPYMDVEYAIEKIGGSIDVFNKLVRLFYEQNAAVSEELYRKSSTDVRGFKTKIHGLKASCANIGAMALAHEATKMEGAINIGNREYVNDNIQEFIEKLVDVLFAIEEYIGFIDSISGMSDEEYALRNSNKNDEATETKLLQEGEIFQYLENIKTFATSEDYAEVSSIMNELHSYNLEGEDKEFIEALNEVVSNKEQEGIIELVNTYYALKL